MRNEYAKYKKEIDNFLFNFMLVVYSEFALMIYR